MKNTTKKIRNIMENNNLFEILTNNSIKTSGKGILTMKSLKNFFAAAVMALIVFSPKETYSQDDFNKVLGEVDSKSMQSLTDAFSSDINSGLYHSAKIKKNFSLYIGVKGMTTEVVEASSTLKVTSVPFAVPQLTTGIYGTDVTLRFVPGITLGKYGSVSTLGFAVRHCFTRYFKKSPVDASVQFAYQSLNLKDSKDMSLISTSSIAANLQISKELSVFTIYTGIQYEKTGADINYEYNGTRVNMHTENQNRIKGTFGLCVKLGPLTLNGDYNVGRNSTITTGFGFSF